MLPLPSSSSPSSRPLYVFLSLFASALFLSLFAVSTSSFNPKSLAWSHEASGVLGEGVEVVGEALVGGVKKGGRRCERT